MNVLLEMLYGIGGSAAPPGFNPATLAALVAGFDARNVGMILPDEGVPLTYVGSAIPFSTVSNPSDPILRSNIINGEPALEFGSGKTLRTSTNVSIGERTVYMVSYQLGASSAYFNNFLASRYDYPDYLIYEEGTYKAYHTSEFSSGINRITGTPIILKAVFTNQTIDGVLQGTIRLKINGVSGPLHLTSPLAPDDTLFFIGNNGQTGVGDFNGYHGAGYILDSTLTPDDDLQLESYLKTRFSISY